MSKSISRGVLFVALTIAQSGQIRPGNLARVTGSEACCPVGLTDQLCNRDYQKNITAAIDKASQLDRQALLSFRVKPTKGKTVLPCVMTYHPDLPEARESVNKHWSIIESSKDLSRVFPEKPIMAYRRPKAYGTSLFMPSSNQTLKIMSLWANLNLVGEPGVKLAR